MKSSLKVLVLLSGLVLIAHPAHAQNASWTGAAHDDNYANANNWSGGVPTGTATVAITSTIDLPGAATALSGDLAITSGTVVINANTAGFTIQTLQVNGGGVLTLNLPTNATVTVLDNLLNPPDGRNSSSYIGTNAGNGQLNVEGTGTLHVTGVEGVGVGFGGTGTFNQTGANVVVAGLIGIGGDGNVPTPTGLGGAGGTGVYNISSGTFNAQDLDIGVGSTTGGTSPTTGVLNINGGEVDSTALELGVGADGASVIKNTTGNIIQTAGLLDTHLGTLDIGETSGGVGYYNLTGGTFTGGTVNVGDLAGSSGTFTQNGATSSATATTLTIGQNGTGLATLMAGQLGINAGGSLNIGNNATGVGTMTQSGGTLTLGAVANLSIGEGGNGTYNLQGGLLTDSNTSGINIGTGTGTATFNMSGGTLTSAGSLNIGGGTGTATFNYGGGALTFPGGMTVNTNGTFNQNHDFNISGFPNASLTLNGGAYNLNSGILTIGGDVTGGTSPIFANAGSTFNFAGGTLATSSAFTDEVNGSVTGSSTIDTTNGDANFTGTLTGNGLLTIQGGNTVTLNTLGGSSSAGSWSIDVVNGTASINANTFPSSGNLTIETSGTVELAENGVNTLTGNVTGNGNGNFNVNFGGGGDLLELTGTVNVTGPTTLTGGGTLEVLNGSFGNIGSAGSLLVGNGTSNGTVNINGIASYSGNTTINPGSTLLANNITSTGVVTDNGILGSNAPITTTIGATTLNIGNAGAGSYGASTGTILIRMAAVGAGVVNTDDITIQGAANVGGTDFSIVNPQITTGTFTILTSSALTGGGAIGQPSSNLFLTQTIVQNGNALELVTTTNTSASIPGLNLTPNEAAVAATLDSLINNNSSLSAGQFQAFSSLLDRVGANGTDAAQLAKNYEQLTPESLQYAQSIAYEHSAFLVSKVDGFDNALHHEFSGFDTSGVSIVLPGFNSGMGRQMQSMLAYDPSSFHQSAPNGVNYYPEGGDTSTSPTTATIDESSSPVSSQRMSDSATTAPMPVRASHSMTIRKPYSNFSAFIGGDGTIADLNQNQGASYAPSSKASYTAVDVIGGISYRMTSNLAAGVLFDYSHTDATTDNYGSKTKVDSFSPGVFATYGEKGFYLNGLFSYGRNNYSNTRAVPVVDGVASSSPDGNQYTAALDAGQDLHLGDDWTITPQGGLTYTHLDIDGFTETGAEPADLSVQAQHDDSLRSRLGASVTYSTFAGHLTLLPTFTALWQHEFLDENAPITSSFNDFSSGAFTIHSVSMGRDSALISVGLTAELSNSMAIFFQANADLNGNYNAENIIGGFKGSF